MPAAVINQILPKVGGPWEREGSMISHNYYLFRGKSSLDGWVLGTSTIGYYYYLIGSEKSVNWSIMGSNMPSELRLELDIFPFLKA